MSGKQEVALRRGGTATYEWVLEEVPLTVYPHGGEVLSYAYVVTVVEREGGRRRTLLRLVSGDHYGKYAPWLPQAVEDFFARVPPEVTFATFYRYKGEEPLQGQFSFNSSFDAPPLAHLLFLTLSLEQVEDFPPDPFTLSWIDEIFFLKHADELIPASFPTTPEAYRFPFTHRRGRDSSALGVLTPLAVEEREELVAPVKLMARQGLPPTLLLLFTPEEREDLTAFLTLYDDTFQGDEGHTPPKQVQADPSVLLYDFPWRRGDLTGARLADRLSGLSRRERASFFKHFFVRRPGEGSQPKAQAELVASLLTTPPPPSFEEAREDFRSFVKAWWGAEAAETLFQEEGEYQWDYLTYSQFFVRLRPLEEVLTPLERAVLLARLLATSFLGRELELASYLTKHGEREVVTTAARFPDLLEAYPFSRAFLWRHGDILLSLLGAEGFARLLLTWPVEEAPLTEEEEKLLLEKPGLLTLPLSWWLPLVRQEVVVEEEDAPS